MNVVKVAYIIIFQLLITCGLSNAQPAGSNIFILGANDVNKPQINCLYQNAQGLILCGTSGGLYSFDGFGFNLYSCEIINPAPVTAVFEDAEKKTWIGYSNGLLGEIKNGKIIARHFAEGNPKVAINSFIQDADGVLWMATAGEGIYYYTKKRWYNINTDDGLSDNYVYKLLYTAAYGVVAATDRGINFCRVENGKKIINTYTSKNGLPDNIVRTITATPDKAIFAGMQDAGICLFKGLNSTTESYPGWNYGAVNDMLYNQSKLYIATGDSALVVCDINYPGSKKISSFKTIQSLAKTNCMLKDHEDNIWVAGENMLMRTNTIKPEKIKALSALQAEQTHCLYACSDSCLWMNDGSSVIRMLLHNGEWQSKTYRMPLPHNSIITAMYNDAQKNIWIGTMGNGVILLNPFTGLSKKISDSLLPANGNIISVTGNQNNVWVSALEGVTKVSINNEKYTFINYTDPSGIGSKYVYNVYTDSKKRTWFATDGDGIYLLDKGKFTHLKNLPGYMGDVVYGILEDAKGNIWYATYDKGVVKFDGKTFTNYTAENGLSDASVSGLLKMGAYLVVLHKNSIDIVNVFNNNFITLDKAANVSALNTDLNAYATNGVNKFYYASGDGIYQFELPEGVIHPPTVFINKIDLFLHDVPIENGHSFSHNQNNLSFYYTGLDYSQPEKLRYQYKLEDYDKEWIATTDNSKNFPSLPPGSYTFRVRVSLNKNFEGAVESSYTFTIEKPFWLQWWFIIVCIATLAALILLIIKMREKGIKKWDVMEKEKIQSQLETLRSQINPHFLFNSFNTLVSEIENNPEVAVTYTETLSDFYRYIVLYRDKDLITLSEEIDVLNNYYYLQKKRFADGLTMRINIPGENLSNIYIAPLVLQLLVENAIKHNIISAASPLQVDVYMEGNDYIAVKNNINRKIQPEKGSGMGLENIQKRYKYLSSKRLEFITTEINFIAKIPLIKNYPV